MFIHGGALHAVNTKYKKMEQKDFQSQAQGKTNICNQWKIYIFRFLVQVELDNCEI